MLISPPFLTAANQNGWNTADNTAAIPAHDREWLDAAFPLAADFSGSFPVSRVLGWHGGLHLVAPAGTGQTTLPIRTIADGTVVYKRDPSEIVSAKDAQGNPLNYGAHEGERCWTSDGVVIIKHTTDIGTGANATQIEFFSV